jgi:ribosome assembly protein YihI (activator of Der GTPase)
MDMRAKPEYRDRPTVEVDCLDALVERADEGMTVLELRAVVDSDIDRIEVALSTLKDDGLISVDDHGGTVRIQPADHVIADEPSTDQDDQTLFDVIRERLGL